MPTTQVNLSSAFNFVGIAHNGTSFSGGMDGTNDYSGTLLGTSATYNSNSYALGATTTNNGTNNCIQCNGQTITLSGSCKQLGLLMCAVNGNKTNLSFTVTYANASTTPFTQSISDWATPQSYAGETEVVGPMSYRDTNAGGTQTGTFYLYGYTFTIDGTKNLSSITVPNNNQVFLFAMDYVSQTTVVTLTGIGSSEVFGTQKSSETTYLTGITPSDAFGTQKIVCTTYLTGIDSDEAFGAVRTSNVLNLTGICSQENFGSPVAAQFFHVASHCFAPNNPVFAKTCGKNTAYLPAITIANSTQLMAYYTRYLQKDKTGIYLQDQWS